MRLFPPYLFLRSHFSLPTTQWIFFPRQHTVAVWQFISLLLCFPPITTTALSVFLASGITFAQPGGKRLKRSIYFPAQQTAAKLAWSLTHFSSESISLWLDGFLVSVYGLRKTNCNIFKNASQLMKSLCENRECKSVMDQTRGVLRVLSLFCCCVQITFTCCLFRFDLLDGTWNIVHTHHQRWPDKWSHQTRYKSKPLKRLLVCNHTTPVLIYRPCTCALVLPFLISNQQIENWKKEALTLLALKTTSKYLHKIVIIMAQFLAIARQFIPVAVMLLHHAPAKGTHSRYGKSPPIICAGKIPFFLSLVRIPGEG